jgi:cytochrome oxidase Cu insertion factor (SCO1/SenC/PrrC family)
MLLRRFVRLLILLAVCAASARAATTIPDVELQDQNGRKVKFYTDLVKDRVVAVNFIFTRCTTVCPGLGVSSAAPAKLAEALAELSAAPAPALAPVEPAPSSPTAPLPAESNASAAAARYFPDTVLLNQHGQPVHFYTDLLKGKVVVISTIFADCGGVCPLIVERFAKVQEKLGDRVGRDVTLISISVDPVNDTPERLHGYAERAGAKPGWHFLTGEKANVDFVLKRLGQYVESRDAHSNIFIIGNEPTGLWKKAFGLAPAEDVIEIVESVLKDERT